MPTPNTITAVQLSRLVGLSDTPAIVDGRIDDDHALDPRMLPGAVRRHLKAAPSWARGFSSNRVIVVCQRGQKLSQGAAAWLRHEGVQAESLEGGFEAWVAHGGPLVRPDLLPLRDEQGRTVWVTRARPKVDRIACPWLIRRFIDPSAVFLFVAPSEVEGVADRFGATTFDIDGTFWSHRAQSPHRPKNGQLAKRKVAMASHLIALHCWRLG